MGLWEYQIEIAPVFGSAGAFTAPVRRVVEMIRNLRRPIAGHVAIVDVALHRLAKPGRAARRVHFPSGREHQRTAHRDMRPRLWLAVVGVLQCYDVFVARSDEIVNAPGLLVYCSQMLHDALLSANRSRNSGLAALIDP